MQVTLIRHTRVNVDPNILYGQLDVGLADTFPKEAAAYRQQLPRDFDAVYSSPLTRCKRLAEALEFPQIEFDDRLKEYNFGNWEGLQREEIDPQIFKTWRANFVNEPAPGGESFLQFYERVSSFYQELVRQDYEKVLIVAHSGVKRCTWSYLLDLPLENLFRMKIGFGEVMQLELAEEVRRSRILRKE